MAVASQELCVGSLNCLGDAFNPFEFLSDDPNFRTACDKLHTAADVLTWDEFMAGSVKVDLSSAAAGLRAHCVEGGKTLFSFFDEGVLKNDNKLLEPRLNLLTFAMRAHGPSGQPTWQLLDNWEAEMKALCDGGSEAYQKDPNLLLWDCACNVIAMSEKDAYRSVCSNSYLNPANFGTLTRTFFDAAQKAAGGRPLVLGLQEWPQNEASAKARAFRAALEEHGLDLICSPSEAGVAVAYSKELKAAAMLPTASAASVMQKCIDEVVSEGETLDKKATDGAVKTTARKVMLVHFPSAPSPAVAATHFLVLHAKEPKTPAAAKVVARFVRDIDDAPLVGLIDANTASEVTATAFAESLGSDGLDVLPEPAVATTSKQRSKLHGQCYDAKKCFKLVRAPKDKVVACKGSLSGAAVHPDMMQETLPSTSWGSDHALTTAIFTAVEGQGKARPRTSPGAGAFFQQTWDDLRPKLEGGIRPLQQAWDGLRPKLQEAWDGLRPKLEDGLRPLQQAWDSLRLRLGQQP
jgi:hypothetical protein